MKNLAQIDLFPEGGLRGRGDLGLEGLGSEEAPTIFNNFLSSSIGIMTIVAVVWFLFTFLGGAYGVLTAGGDKANLETARKRILMGLMGIVIIISAVFILDIFGEIIGLPDILNPAEMLNSIVQ